MDLFCALLLCTCYLIFLATSDLSSCGLSVGVGVGCMANNVGFRVVEQHMVVHN